MAWVDVRPVPNAPCGVERYGGIVNKDFVKEFLMHRVELKDIFIDGTMRLYNGS